MRRFSKLCLPAFAASVVLLGGCLGNDGEDAEEFEPISGVEWVVSPRQHSVRGDTLFLSSSDTTYDCSTHNPVREIREVRDTVIFQVVQDSLFLVGDPYARRGFTLDSFPKNFVRDHYVRLGSGDGLNGRWKLAAADVVPPPWGDYTPDFPMDTAILDLFVWFKVTAYLHYHDFEIEIGAAGFSEWMDHHTADQGLDAWKGEEWGMGTPTLFDSLTYDVSVTKVDAYTLRYAGRVTREVATVRTLPDGATRMLSNRSGRKPYAWKSRRTPGNCDPDTYWFNEFLSENFKSVSGKGAAP
jgi:hypothetical protein